MAMATSAACAAALPRVTACELAASDKCPAAIDQVLEQGAHAFAFGAEILGGFVGGRGGHVLQVRSLALRRFLEAGDDVGEALAGQLGLHLGRGAEAVSLLHQPGGGGGDLLRLQLERGFQIRAGLLGGGDQLVALRDGRAPAAP